MAAKIITPSADDLKKMFDKDRHAARTKEVADFLKCVKGNPLMFFALTDFGALDGHGLDPECCAPVGKKTLNDVCRDFFLLVVEGDMPIDGSRYNAWNIGNMGSRWADMDAKPYGLTYIRAAFYSKKDDPENWPYKKPYAIHITCEKEA